MITKEKIVAGVALLLVASSLRTARWPRVEQAPELLREEEPRLPRVTVPVPALRPERLLEAGARDPFIPTSAWVPATPALLAVPPSPSTVRALPGGTLSGKGQLVTVEKDPESSGEEK